MDRSVQNDYRLGMGRPRQFDEAEVLDAAMVLFWTRGFAACGMQDLQDATGLSRASLYNAFGSKQGLFVAVIAHYDRRVDAGLAPLLHASADLSTARTYLLEALTTFRRHGSGGCLVVSTALAPVGADPDVRAATMAAGGRVRKAFASLVRQCQERGTLGGADPERAADHLYALLHGLAALRATGGSDAALVAALDLSLSALETS